jgi:hypothetical protein
VAGLSPTRRMKTLITWFLAGTAFFAALGLEAEDRSLPSEGFWSERGWLAMSAVLAVAFIPSAQAVLLQVWEQRRNREMERTRVLEELLSPLLTLAEQWGTNYKHVGGQVFVVKRDWLLRETHVRVAQARLSRKPAPAVRWTKGKGVIGKCWETSTFQSADLLSTFDGHEKCDAEAWGKLSQEQTFRLDFQDFKNTIAIYGYVAAYPITDRRGDNKYLGCVSFDVRCDTGMDADRRREIISKVAQSSAAIEAELEGIAFNAYNHVD